MSITRTALLAAAVLAAAAPVAPAFAGCVGTAATVSACVHPENVQVDPTGGPAVDDCVVLVDPDHCVPVHVATPSVTTTGPLVDGVTCTICGGVVPVVAGVVDRVDEASVRVVDQLSRMECAPATGSRSALELRSVDTLRENVDAFLESCL
ncbi:MAG TPA: hypothetical protein VF519_09825 [Mycobacteriales bacterium]|jgi:mRNA-degrading endonuclease toxin of MazEF toxin-antitoxin module